MQSVDKFYQDQQFLCGREMVTKSRTRVAPLGTATLILRNEHQSANGNRYKYLQLVMANLENFRKALKGFP